MLGLEELRNVGLQLLQVSSLQKVWDWGREDCGHESSGDCELWPLKVAVGSSQMQPSAPHLPVTYFHGQ